MNTKEKFKFVCSWEGGRGTVTDTREKVQTVHSNLQFDTRKNRNEAVTGFIFTQLSSATTSDPLVCPRGTMVAGSLERIESETHRVLVARSEGWGLETTIWMDGVSTL